MKKILLLGVAAFGIAAYSSAPASARTVCNEDGRCWNERTDVGRDIVRGLVQGRSAYRDHDDWHRRDDYNGPRGDYDGPRHFDHGDDR